MKVVREVKNTADKAGGVNLLLTALGAVSMLYGIFQIGKVKGASEVKVVETKEEE